jgi:hypothetical protein
MHSALANTPAADVHVICLNPCLRSSPLASMEPCVIPSFCLPREQYFTSKFCSGWSWLPFCFSVNSNMFLLFHLSELESNVRKVHESKQQQKATTEKRWFLLGLEMNSNTMSYAFSLIDRIWLQERGLLAIHCFENYGGVFSVFSWQ